LLRSMREVLRNLRWPVLCLGGTLQLVRAGPGKDLVRRFEFTDKGDIRMTKYVAFSGGKDSTALALLLPDSIPVFTDTGAEFPEMYGHIEKFEKVTGREVIRLKSKEGSLLDYMRRTKFMPGHAARYCTRIFKIEPFEKFTDTYAVAIRADENRKGNTSDKVIYPLREMGIGLMDVIQICTEYDLLPRYPVYMARGGCVNCYYKRKSEVLAMDDFVPEVLDELQDIEDGVQDKRGRFAFMFPNSGMSIRDIRKQMSLFSPEDVYREASDKSDYGQACGMFCNR